MAFIIEDQREVLVTHRMDGTPEWSFDPENASRFVTKEKAVKVRGQLGKFGLNPKIKELR